MVISCYFMLFQASSLHLLSVFQLLPAYFYIYIHALEPPREATTYHPPSPEVVAPLGDAVGLVDGEKRHSQVP